MTVRAVSEVIAPVTLDKASDLPPVSEASFEELRAANAELRASDASLEQANSKSVAALEAADAKLKELFPVSVGYSSCLLPTHHSLILTVCWSQTSLEFASRDCLARSNVQNTLGSSSDFNDRA